MDVNWNTEGGNIKKILRIGTWNIRGLNGKEIELEEEIEETKKKGKGIIETEDGNVLLYSGVQISPVQPS